MHPISRAVGLVHHAPQGVDADTFGAACEWMFLNTAHTKIYLPINAMAVASCVIGKSLMFRRSALNRAIGGLEALSVYMSEDNQIGIGILKAGLRHRLSVCTAKQPLGVGTFRSYMDRRVRWTRIRAWSMPAVTFLEPWYECLFSGLTGALALHHFYDMPMLSVFVAHVLYWFICDLVMVRGLTQKSRPWPSLWWFVRAWIVRELSALPIYIYALSTGRRVTWRGKEYLLQVGGTVVEVDKGGPNVAASVKR